MAQYAAKTSVPVERSRAEIERTLERYGATSFAYGWDQDRAVIQFAAQDRQVRFLLPLPAKDDPAFTHFRRGQHGALQRRTENAAREQWEQACRQRWRALALAIKAKLEAVESEISDFEDEFLAHIVLPDGSTAGQWLRPQLATAYATARMPSVLPALGPGGD
jgi:hypothetical protein